MKTTADLFREVQAVCSTLVGISVGDKSDHETWELQFADGTTPAAQAAAQAVADAFDFDDPEDVAGADDRALASLVDGSVLKAVAYLVFVEINKLRVKTGDPAYTKAQFLAALKAQMRSGT